MGQPVLKPFWPEVGSVATCFPWSRPYPDSSVRLRTSAALVGPIGGPRASHRDCGQELADLAL